MIKSISFYSRYQYIKTTMCLQIYGTGFCMIKLALRMVTYRPFGSLLVSKSLIFSFPTVSEYYYIYNFYCRGHHCIDIKMTELLHVAFIEKFILARVNNISILLFSSSNNINVTPKSSSHFCVFAFNCHLCKASPEYAVRRHVMYIDVPWSQLSNVVLIVVVTNNTQILLFIYRWVAIWAKTWGYVATVICNVKSYSFNVLCYITTNNKLLSKENGVM